MGLGGGAYPPLYQCAVLSLEGDPVRVAVYTAALTVSRGCMEWKDCGYMSPLFD